MKKTLILSLFASVLLISANVLRARRIAPQKKYTTEYVVIFLIDGPRYSETYGDSAHSNIPFMYNELLPQSSFVDNFRNNGSTYTIPGHAAICTGRYQRLSNDGSDLPKYPSMFQHFLQQKGLASDQAWVVASKGKLNVLTNTSDKDWKDKFMPNSYCGPKGSNTGYGYDTETFPKAKEIMTQFHPKLMLINMLDVDVWGHANEWGRYIKAIKDTDSLAYEMWNFIQNDPVYKNKTTMFITNDHGRHLNGVKNGFVSHGGGCEGCRHITLMALGPDFKINHLVKKKYEQIDLSATIAELLEFDIPQGKGDVMEDLFVNCKQQKK